MTTPSGNEAHGAGWYPDPSGRHVQRYWDGTTWSAYVSDGGTTSSDPMPPPGPPPLTVAPAPPRKRVPKKTILRVAAVFIVIGAVAWFANRDAPVTVAPVTSPGDITVPADPVPPQSTLRRRYAGTYENAVDGTSLWLRKNGKYSYEDYIQWGGDLTWWVTGRTIRVETYKNVDWAGNADVKEDVYDIRRGGDVLVLRKGNARADAGTRYVKVSKDRT